MKRPKILHAEEDTVTVYATEFYALLGERNDLKASNAKLVKALKFIMLVHHADIESYWDDPGAEAHKAWRKAEAALAKAKGAGT